MLVRATRIFAILEESMPPFGGLCESLHVPKQSNMAETK